METRIKVKQSHFRAAMNFQKRVPTPENLGGILTDRESSRPKI